MAATLPVPFATLRDDVTTDQISGGYRNDHLIHHRDPATEGHAATGLFGFSGDDILEASVPNGGQIHMFGSRGDDWFILDVTKIADANGILGHHVYGGHGENTFQFNNISENQSPIVGRLDDFNPTTDHILIEDTEVDLTDLPQTITLRDGSEVHVRVIAVDHPAFINEDLGPQHFLAIGNDIFYALEGARDLGNGTTGLTGEETHFLDASALDELRSAETVAYENPDNFVPHDFYAHREDELKLNFSPVGAEVTADTGDKDAAHIYGAKGPQLTDGTRGEQVMRGSDGDDVIDGNTGNDTIVGGKGDDLIAGGVDNDSINGDAGYDTLWGGDGDDTITGGWGDDLLQGGRGDDVLSGGDGDDTVFGGEGNDTLTGGGGPDAVNRFHFYEDSGSHVITDFKVGLDQITLQDDIDPLTVELYENEAGNTVINHGLEGSIELTGVSLKDFQTAAEDRVDAEEPIMSITTDPEAEMLQELRVETGYYGNEAPPSLQEQGVTYGVAALADPETGEYRYVSEHCAHDEHDEADDHEGHDGHGEEPGGEQDPEHSGEHEHCIPTLPEEEDNGAEDKDDDEDVKAADTTCFVATAAYNDPWHPDVKFLRAFRDGWLVHRAWGRVFITVYWRVGPPLAAHVRRHPRLARPARRLIATIVTVLRKLWKI